ncbi:spermidine/putrescine ABC transporter ATPase subunit [Candidatus Koribacter versatilis Ellin345]|uniref:Spermidine/putrescine import ATP-binding protein PotA n=1 Tax=Koribacter versatilis (strain Ellin345) TaxID=204669 RepID=Q1IRF7_KORVE|nr:ABC transporter ATP-binding protein [Candidatus Koribacter versatilis]ABF40543.1 spermidine/putrescine ABC transporter ATPase subunit [Candidatus Koribacter versatilis Ellin345]
MTTSSVPENVSVGQALLAVDCVAKRFGKNIVLRDVSLTVAQGEFLSILGESGSGKTTLLRLIAGFEQPDGGTITMAGERIENLPPYKRRVNTVFQSYALFPHLNVEENVAYGLKVNKTSKGEIPKRVQEALAMVKMESFAKSKPSKLSGGQQQRVALARALVNRPKLLLLDEPLSALDANLRREMQFELKSLQREVGIAFVFVTHDQEEAMTMSDRVALLRYGALEQIASPREIYAKPATAYVAQFIGHSNLLRCTVSRGIARCGNLMFTTSAPDGPAVFSLRPEAIRIASTASDQVRFKGTVARQVFQGATELYELDAGGFRLNAKIYGSGVPSGESEFECSPADIVVVKESL